MIIGQHACRQHATDSTAHYRNLHCPFPLEVSTDCGWFLMDSRLSQRIIGSDRSRQLYLTGPVTSGVQSGWFAGFCSTFCKMGAFRDVSWPLKSGG